MLYSFYCEVCAKEFTELLSMANRNNPTPCPDCGELGARLAGGTRNVQTDIMSDKWVKNRNQKMAQEKKQY